MESALKTDRILHIYSKLAHGEIVRKEDLAQEFRVTERSIQRDIENLRCFLAEQSRGQELIYSKRERGYRIINTDLDLSLIHI